MASTSIVLVVSTLIHGLVRNPDRQDLGRIEDLAIDISSGRVVYAVLSFHGLLGFENKLFAIPWDAFNFDPDDKTMVLEVSAETLENAPSFDKDEWPDMNEGAWGEAIRRPPRPDDGRPAAPCARPRRARAQPDGPGRGAPHGGRSSGRGPRSGNASPGR